MFEFHLDCEWRKGNVTLSTFSYVLYLKLKTNNGSECWKHFFLFFILFFVIDFVNVNRQCVIIIIHLACVWYTHGIIAFSKLSHCTMLNNRILFEHQILSHPINWQMTFHLEYFLELELNLTVSFSIWFSFLLESIHISQSGRLRRFTAIFPFEKPPFFVH